MVAIFGGKANALKIQLRIGRDFGAISKRLIYAIKATTWTAEVGHKKRRRQQRQTDRTAEQIREQNQDEG